MGVQPKKLRWHALDERRCLSFSSTTIARRRLVACLVETAPGTPPAVTAVEHKAVHCPHRVRISARRQREPACSVGRPLKSFGPTAQLRRYSAQRRPLPSGHPLEVFESSEHRDPNKTTITTTTTTPTSRACIRKSSSTRRSKCRPCQAST